MSYVESTHNANKAKMAKIANISENYGNYTQFLLKEASEAYAINLLIYLSDIVLFREKNTANIFILREKNRKRQLLSV